MLRIPFAFFVWPLLLLVRHGLAAGTLRRSPVVDPRLSFLEVMATNGKPPASETEVRTPDSVCDPPCIQGKGVCNDKHCFCISGYYGDICQFESEEQGLRVPFVPAMGGFGACVIIGCLLGVGCFKCLVLCAPSAKYEEQEEQIEVWKPLGS